MNDSANKTSPPMHNSGRILILSTNSDEAGAPRHVEIISKYLNNHYKVYTVFGGNIGKVFHE